MAVFAHGQLRLYLLALLEQGSKHGYELITALSERFAGVYRPSAGTIYPRLARLESEGLVQRVDDGRKGTYALTDKGRAELNERRAELADLEIDLDRTVRELANQVRREVAGSMATLRADLAAAADEARRAAAARAAAGHDNPADRGSAPRSNRGRRSDASRGTADSSAQPLSMSGAAVPWPESIVAEWHELEGKVSAAVSNTDRHAIDIAVRALRKARIDIDRRLR